MYVQKYIDKHREYTYVCMPEGMHTHKTPNKARLIDIPRPQEYKVMVFIPFTFLENLIVNK